MAGDGMPRFRQTEAPIAEPDGYRGPPYRAEVPATLLGEPGLTPEQALGLHKQGAVFIDVLPRDRRPPDLPQGTIWRDRPHETIPGAIWLPGVGYEALAPEQANWFAAVLHDLRAARPDAPLVFFCQSDCWMSWNAARRAVETGHDHVLWFPEGQEGWSAMGQDLAPATPHPGQP